MNLSVGQAIDRYRVQGVLGSGGMATVYLVRHEGLGTLHALKLLHVPAAAVRARLVQEGRVQGALRHPHVVAVTDLVDLHGAPGLVMEYVEGPSLDTWLRQGQLSRVEVDVLARQLLESVVAAHDADLVHRDLKPGNVLVSVSGGRLTLKVTDFGLVKVLGAEGGPVQTKSGIAMGTPAYMAPEQIHDAKDVDHRADLFALGAILYELATGRMAFEGDTALEVMIKVAHGRFRPIDTVAPDLPPRMQRAIGWAMQTERSERPADCRALLEAWCGQAPAPTPPWDAEALAEIGALAPTVAPEGPVDSAEPTFPPGAATVPGLRPRTGFVPRERDPFVGREALLGDLGARLRSGARLVSVLGTGGAGKTRLVTHYIGSDACRPIGGAWFCDLADARDRAGVVAAVARALDVPVGAGDPIEQLGHAIAGRGPSVVVLDNVEQVMAPAIAALRPWLDRAPDAQFIVTSRQRLGLPGEAVIEVQPLSTDAGAALFVLRAEAAKPGFVLSAEDFEVVEQLVVLLDGLPLAIELAAARIRLMSPRKLLSRMGERFRLLASPDGRTDRQATLRAALDWSWDLLTPAERAVLAQISVFEGGFGLEAAEAVVDLDGFDDAPWTMDVLQALVDRSLLKAGDADDLPEPVFSMLVSVQAYATEQRRRLQLDDAEVRHGTWFAAMGTDAAIDALDGVGGSDRRRALVREAENLEAAVHRAVARGDGPVAARAALAVWEALRLTVPFEVGAELLLSAASVPGLGAADRSALHRNAGWALSSAGQRGEATRLLELALEEAQASGNPRAEGRARSDLARDRAHFGDHDAAEAHDANALRIAREHGDELLEGIALAGQAEHAQSRGHLEASQACFAAALAVMERNGDERNQAVALGQLGTLHKHQGRLPVALELYDRSLALARRVGDRRLQGNLFTNQAIVAVIQGRHADAEVLYERALAIHRDVGNRKSEGHCIGNTGSLLAQLGRLEEAAERFSQALAIARELGNRPGQGTALCNLAGVLRNRGDASGCLLHYRASLQVLDGIEDRTRGLVHLAMGQVHVDALEFDEADRALTSGEALLRAIGDELSLGRLWCLRVWVAKGRGQPAAARTALASAEEIFGAAGLGPESELARSIVRARARLEAE